MNERQIFHQLITIKRRLETYPYVQPEVRFLSHMVAQVVNTLMEKPITIPGMSKEELTLVEAEPNRDSLGRPLPPGQVEVQPGIVHHGPEDTQVINDSLTIHPAPAPPDPNEEVNQWSGPDGTSVQQTRPMVAPQGAPIDPSQGQAAPAVQQMQEMMEQMAVMAEENRKLREQIQGVGSSNTQKKKNNRRKKQQGGSNNA